MPDAKVVSYDIANDDGSGIGSKEKQINLMTDLNGQCQYQGESSDYIYASVYKGGYYKSIIKKIPVTSKSEDGERWFLGGKRLKLK